MTKFVVDASVLVALYDSKDNCHAEIVEWFSSLDGTETLVAPSLLLTELASSFKQCEIPRRIYENARAMVETSFEFLDLTKARAADAGEIAYATASRGADTTYIQAAREKKATLVTKDAKQKNSAHALNVKFVFYPSRTS